MSYGIWRKRGQGWCSIEIDTPGNGTQLYELKYENELSHKLLVSGLRNNDIVFDDYCDYYQLRWELNQVKSQPQRTIVEYCPGGGEHVRWIAYDNDAALYRALEVVEASEYDMEQCGFHLNICSNWVMGKSFLDNTPKQSFPRMKTVVR